MIAAMSMSLFVARILASTAKSPDDLAELHVENDARLAVGHSMGDVIAKALREREDEIKKRAKP